MTIRVAGNGPEGRNAASYPSVGQLGLNCAPREAVVDRVAACAREDIAILAKLRAGRRSGGCDGGRFSPFHETTTHRSQTLITRALHGPSRDTSQPLLRTSHR